MSTPLFEAGEITRSFTAAVERIRANAEFRQALQRVNAAMKGFAESLPQTPEAWAEARSIARYDMAVAHERVKGLMFVKAEADRVRAELGLPYEPSAAKVVKR